VNVVFGCRAPALGPDHLIIVIDPDIRHTRHKRHLAMARRTNNRSARTITLPSTSFPGRGPDAGGDRGGGEGQRGEHGQSSAG